MHQQFLLNPINTWVTDVDDGYVYSNYLHLFMISAGVSSPCLISTEIGGRVGGTDDCSVAQVANVMFRIWDAERLLTHRDSDRSPCP